MEKDFQNTEAVKKLQSIAGDIRFCMYTTIENGKIHSKPMTAQDIDSDGNIWFFASKKDNSNGQSIDSGHVTLIYANPSDNTYLSISGKPEAIQDEEKKEELWNPMVDAWFDNGKDDPDLLMIRVNTEEAAYWDSGASKMVVFFSMIKASITGSTPDGGNHGTLDLD